MIIQSLLSFIINSKNFSTMSKLHIPMYKNDLFFTEFGEYQQVLTHNVRVDNKPKRRIIKSKIKNEVQYR